MKKSGLLLVLAIVAIFAFTIYSAITAESPQEKMDRELKNIKINVNQDAADAITKSINDHLQTLDTLNSIEKGLDDLEKQVRDTLDSVKAP